MAYAAPLPRIPATPIVVEAPESVGLLLYAYAKTNHTERFETLVNCLETAAYDAARSLSPDYTVRAVIPHLNVDSDPSAARPHAHLVVSGTVVRTHYEGRAHLASVTYQIALRNHLRDTGWTTMQWPCPHGWEIAGTGDSLDVVERRRCGHALYPLDTYAEPARSIG